jgi:hypothetical protein
VFPHIVQSFTATRDCYSEYLRKNYEGILIAGWRSCSVNDKSCAVTPQATTAGNARSFHNFRLQYDGAG